MLYLIGHTKGGVGKTTIATNLASVLAVEGSVCLVDADAQRQANDWAALRLALPDVPPVDCRVLGGKVRIPLQELSRRYKHIVVDAGGADSQELRSALCIADVCLAPFAPSLNDLKAFRDLAKITADAHAINEQLRVFALPNKVEYHAKRQDRLPQAIAYVREQGFDVLRARLTLRAAPYNRATETGMGLGELREAGAYAELLAVLGELHSRMQERAA